MQISIGKQGTKLKLTKRERDVLDAAVSILDAVGRHGDGVLKDVATEAYAATKEVARQIRVAERTEQTAAA
jgi:hypothetical protein